MRVDHIERRVGEQMVLMESISAAYGQLVRPGIENISRQRLETRLEAVNNDWEKFRLNHSAINIAADKLDTSEQKTLRSLPYFDDHLYAATQEHYLETVEKFKILMAQQLEMTSRASTSSDAAQISITSQPRLNQHDLRLPRINLPHYDGTHQDWLSFKDLFSSMVVANQSISPIEKMHYLKNCLRGPAAQLLDTTTVTADNFYQAWETLKSFYDSRRILVGSTLDSFFAIKPVKHESGLELERLYTSVTQVYRSLQTLRRPVEYWDDILVYIIVRQKLDSRSIRAWEQHIGSSDEPPTWDKLQSFIISRSRTLRAIENSHSRKAVSSPRSQRPGLKSHFVSHKPNKNEKKSTDSCQLCSGNHKLFRCPTYQRKNVREKTDFIKGNKLCYNCLGPHQVARCQSTFRCQTCGKKHHSSLHQKHSESTTSQEQEPPKQVNHVHSNPATVILATAQIRASNSKGKTMHIRALLDQGSEISLISEKLAQQLELKRRPTSLPIIGVGAQQSGKTKGIATVIIQPRFNSTFRCILNAHILPKLTSTIPAQKTQPTTWNHTKDLCLADPNFTEPGTIDIIIGADTYGTLLEEKIVQGPPQSPTAQLTKLGWVISGPASSSREAQHAAAHHCSVDHDLHELLEKFWRQEEVNSSKKHLSAEDEECEKIFRETHSRNPKTGQYIVRLPFKANVSNLGNSKPSATRMLHNLQRKFTNDPEYHQLYSAFLHEYEQLGHMVRLPKNTSSLTSFFFLPHHGVKRESSTTTKLRVVFNGSCKTIDGQPINSLLHAGSKLQLDLFDILVWLRQHRYLFSADIEKMYRQIQVHQDDWKYQQILWKEKEEIITFQLTTVTYGLACAPYLALRSVLQLIEDEGKNFPAAVDTLSKGRYVDDVFGGADSIIEAQDKAKQVHELCMAGGFPLRKWISNHSEILKTIPEKYRVTSVDIPIQEQSVHALGLQWNPAKDHLHFNLAAKQEAVFTKRAVLSKIAQLFDPLGLLSPIFITAKIFMQELWAIKLHWDDQLPPTQHKTWTTILHSLEGLETISIPRWLGTLSTSIIEIHGFCDASQLAMSAVVYCVTRENNKITTNIICSKTKVAPLKRLTIPRLELSAAVLLTKLTSKCIEILKLQQASCYLWTDSSITFTWIKNHPSRWKEFIHNRVCLIQEMLPKAQWRHVPGEQNPADCASRGVSSLELKTHPLWWNGPSWLQQEPASWPNMPSKRKQHSPEDLEERPSSTPVVVHTTMMSTSWELLYRFSSYNKLIRMTAMCRRIIKRFKRISSPGINSPLTPDELEDATKYWVRVTQQHKFMTEVSLLRRSMDLPKSHPLVKLFPFLDQEGILRVGGRLRNSLLPTNSKHPYILPKESKLSTLIIRNAHEKTMHGSTQETLAYIRQNFWIIGGRHPIKAFIKGCPKCIRYRAQTATHIMGQLPTSRVTPGRAFLHSGVDYAGPFITKTWRGRSAKTYKSWVALFVCLSTSALHLELVTDYSTDAFIAAYKRFTSRRGICATLSSDCGTNFKGADSQLRQFFSQQSSELQQISSLLLEQGTKWIFNPPSSPHFGGKWEAGVKSMKHHLRRIVGETLLTYEEFSTILCQIEGILNSRPLCPLTDDPNDLDVLTPGHFLVGHAINLIPEPSLQHLKVSRLSRWQHLSFMTQSFWNKWSKEYLQRYLTTYKWRKESNPIQEGSIVLITDERYPPAKWPLGRVMKLHQGSDGVARVATVKTSTSTLTKPIVKLCPLNITSAACSSPESTKAGGKC